MYFIKLLIFALAFKFFCCIGVLEPEKNKVPQTINFEQAHVADSIGQHKKMGIPNYTPISIIIQ